MNHNYKLIFSTLSLIAILVTACSTTTLDIAVETATPAGTGVASTTPPPAAATRTSVQFNAPTATPEGTPIPAGEPTQTAPPEVSPTLPALSPDIWEMHTYHNVAHGITFDYPAMYDDRHDLNCMPRTQENAQGVTVSIGLRSSVSLLAAGSLNAQDYVSQTLTDQGLTPDFTTEETIAGAQAIRVDYRFGGTNRSGTFSVVQIGDRLAVFEMTAGGFCEIPQSNLFEPQVYVHMKTTFQLGPSSSSEVNPIIRSFLNNDTTSLLLLGGTQGERWLDAPATSALLVDGMSYQLYSPSGYLGATTGKTSASNSPICPGSYGLNVEPLPASDATGLAGSWNAMPRIPEMLSNETETYRQVIASLLSANGVSQPDVTLTQVLRVDLEGDGDDEVLISASNFAGASVHGVEAGYYALVMLRTVVNNEVITVPLVADYYLEAEVLTLPRTYTIGGVLDLNGDGRMEVLVDVTYWEGSDVMVYEVENDDARQVLSTGCR